VFSSLFCSEKSSAQLFSVSFRLLISYVSSRISSRLSISLVSTSLYHLSRGFAFSSKVDSRDFLCLVSLESFVSQSQQLFYYFLLFHPQLDPSKELQFSFLLLLQLSKTSGFVYSQSPFVDFTSPFNLFRKKKLQ
jgi:hypothetical protein